jgi:hypothetical protein
LSTVLSFLVIPAVLVSASSPLPPPTPGIIQLCLSFQSWPHLETDGRQFVNGAAPLSPLRGHCLLLLSV